MKSHYHCVYDMKYHLVLVTKYRHPCFTNNILNRLEEICRKQCEQWEVELIEFGGESDHIHLLLSLNPTIQPSKLVNSLKTVSSRLIRKDFPDEVRESNWKPVL